MKTHLVRHGRAVSRAEWPGDEILRPLSDSGEEQAEALADHFAQDPPTRILSAPSLRCQQTVQPLAARLGIEIEIDERLSRGEPVARALELLPTYDEGALLLCTHSDVVIGLLQILELADVDRPECRKGSAWTLTGRGYTPSHATYVEPVRAVRRRGQEGTGERAAAAERETTRAAVFDLGSTSFNLLIADLKHDGTIAPVVREKVMLRLGAVIASGASLPDEVCERACEVAEELSEVARREKVEHYFPVATAALRAAENGIEVAHRIGAVLGHPIQVLSGEEEARTIFRAFQQRIDLGSEPVLGLDLGGGSLELVIGNDSGIDRELTLELGVVRLHGELCDGDPMSKAAMRRIRGRVHDVLGPHADAFGGARISGAIATGGTVRALMRLVDEKYALRGPRGEAVRIDREQLRELRRSLVRSTHEERLRMRGIRKARADLLPTGAVILEAVAEQLELDGYRICDWGLREGVLLTGLIDRA